MDEDAKENMTDKALWSRALLMFLFYVVFNILELVVGCMGLVQLALALFTKKPNENLTSLGASLGTYLNQIVEFITFSSEEKPYPFGPWPNR